MTTDYMDVLIRQKYESILPEGETIDEMEGYADVDSMLGSFLNISPKIQLVRRNIQKYWVGDKKFSTLCGIIYRESLRLFNKDSKESTPTRSESVETIHSATQAHRQASRRLTLGGDTPQQPIKSTKTIRANIEKLFDVILFTLKENTENAARIQEQEKIVSDCIAQAASILIGAREEYRLIVPDDVLELTLPEFVDHLWDDLSVVAESEESFAARNSEEPDNVNGGFTCGTYTANNTAADYPSLDRVKFTPHNPRNNLNPTPQQFAYVPAPAREISSEAMKDLLVADERRRIVAILFQAILDIEHPTK